MEPASQTIDKCVQYKGGYKYQTTRLHVFQTAVRPEKQIVSGFLVLSTDGLLFISAGYAWDGASYFPDFDWIVRGSLIHDALYQLIREELLDQSFKELADRELEAVCIEDGAWHWQASSVYHGVAAFGGYGANPENKRPVLTAPKKYAIGG